MSEERVPLKAVAGLGRTSLVPSPPPRRQSNRVSKVAATEARADNERKAEARTRNTKKPVAPSADTTGRSRRLTLSLPSSLLDRLRMRARVEGVSQPEIILDAIVASQDRLGDLLAGAKPSVGSDGVFLRRPIKPPSPEPISTLSIRILTANLAVIDQLVADHASPSRSALCVAALQDFLK